MIIIYASMLVKQPILKNFEFESIKMGFCKLKKPNLSFCLHYDSCCEFYLMFQKKKNDQISLFKWRKIMIIALQT